MSHTPSVGEPCHRCGTPAEEGDRYCMICGIHFPHRDGEDTVPTSTARPENPWKRLVERPPFVLEEDRPQVECFTSSLRPGDTTEINLYLTPVPREGPVSAPLILLQLNPSYDTSKPYGHGDEPITRREIDSIRDENYPHIGVVTHDDWWTPRLRHLALEPGVGWERVARGVCSIDYFPYRSVKFGHAALRLPSQGYTFDLVRERRAAGAVFAVMRGFRLWATEFPELEAKMGRTVFRTNSVQNSYITRKNLPDGFFDLVSEHLRRL